MNDQSPVIRTADQHRAALAEIETLMGAKAGTREGARLDALTIAVQKYERTHYDIARIGHLSNRKLKAFDRQGGAYLALAWPADLPVPTNIAVDEERAATSREHLVAIKLVARTALDHGLIHIATQVTIRGINDRMGGAPLPYLLAHLVTPRWQRITVPGCAAPAQYPS